jgi:hypothetical protein
MPHEHTDERLSAIAAGLAAGKTYAEIGLELGVSRQRVEQLVKKHRPDVPRPKQRSAIRRTRASAEWDAAWGEVVRDVAERHSSIAAIAAELGQPETDVARFLRNNGLRPAGPRRQAPTFSDDDLLTAVRNAASAVGEPLTAVRYSEWAEQQAHDRAPSQPTIFNRFGSWVAACAAAGVRPGDASRPTYTRTWTSEGCLEVLRKWLDTQPATTSVAAYEATRARSVDDMPSSPTIRNRLGGWASSQQAARRWKGLVDSGAIDPAALHAGPIVRHVRSTWSGEEARTALVQFVEWSVGERRHPSAVAYDHWAKERGAPRVHAVTKSFGSWNAALLAVGFTAVAQSPNPAARQDVPLGDQRRPTVVSSASAGS